MKAVQFSRFGAPSEVADVVEVPEPGAPGAGQVLAALVCSPINPADLLNLQGLYGTPPALPAVGGFEGVARVVAVGEGVTHLKVGDHVLLLVPGAWRERFVLPAAGLAPLPPGLPPEQAAMLTINPLTARALVRDAGLKPGEWVIKNAANSGVGRSFFAFARAAGLRAIGVVRRPGLEDLVKGWGAEHVLVDGPDLAERVRALVGDGTLRYGVDAVGGAATARIAACLGTGGVVVNYGLLSGEDCRVSASDLVFRDISLRGFWLVNWFQRTPPAEVGAAFGEVIGLLAKGDLTTPVEATYPLSRAREALAHAARGGRSGKVLLTAG